MSVHCCSLHGVLVYSAGLCRRLNVCPLLQLATERTSETWVARTTWRSDAPGRIGYLSSVISTSPRAARTLGTLCR
jgi:hypothetical protein